MKTNKIKIKTDLEDDYKNSIDLEEYQKDEYINFLKQIPKNYKWETVYIFKTIYNLCCREYEQTKIFKIIKISKLK